MPTKEQCHKFIELCIAQNGNLSTKDFKDCGLSFEQWLAYATKEVVFSQVIKERMIAGYEQHYTEKF